MGPVLGDSNPIALQRLDGRRTNGTLICILGAPGSGKSTLASALAAELGYLALRSGQLIREFVLAAPDGIKRQEARESLILGLPVSVELYCEIAQHFLADQRPVGVILDGYPRSLEQCDRMSEILQAVKLPNALVVGILLDAPLRSTWRRLARRMVCAACNTELDTKTGCCSQRRPTRRADDSARMILSRTRRFRAAYTELEPSFLRLGRMYRLDAACPLADILHAAKAIV
jgi:adenylate kinase